MLDKDKYVFYSTIFYIVFGEGRYSRVFETTTK